MESKSAEDITITKSKEGFTANPLESKSEELLTESQSGALRTDVKTEKEGSNDQVQGKKSIDIGSFFRRKSKGILSWDCPQCHNSNSISESTCSTCNYPENVQVASEGSIEYNKEKEAEQPGWGCPFCTFFNSGLLPECEICGTSKPLTRFITAENMKMKKEQNNWRCPRCSYDNMGKYELCQMCEFEPSLLKEGSYVPSVESLQSESSSEQVEDITLLTKDEILDLIDLNILGSFLIDPTHVAFKIWSPNAEKIYVSGEFNHWSKNHPRYELKRHPKYSDTFYGIFSNVTPDSVYKYSILTKEGKYLWRTDPRSLSLVPGRYNYNSQVYDPNSFNWISDYVPPRWSHMILYEIHIGSFTKEGTFNSAIEKFEYLKELGINTIALMPITQDSHDDCWGYDPSSLFAIHRNYGTPKDLQNFVNEAHKNKIAVILDWVPNHMSPKSSLNNFDTIDNDGPYFYSDDRRNTDFGPKLDYSKSQVRDYILHSAISFLRYFNFDGIRVDSTITMRRKYSDKEEQNVEAWTLLQELNDTIHKLFPYKIMIAEDLQGNNRMNYPLCGFDSQWDDRFFSTLFTTSIEPSDSNRNMRQITDAVGHSFHGLIHNRIIYTENHDTIPENRQRRFPEAIYPGKGDRNFFAIKRSVLCAGILTTSPGLPMILQGQEFLETSCPNWPIPPTLDWSKYEKFNSIFLLYKDLFELRINKFNHTKGLTSPNVLFPHINDNNKVVVYHRYDKGGPGDDVMVVVNFSNTTFREYSFGVPRSGTWKVRFNSDSKKYFHLFEDIGSDSLMAKDKPQDGFFFSVSLRLGRYSIVILSMDPV